MGSKLTCPWLTYIDLLNKSCMLSDTNTVRLFFLTFGFSTCVLWKSYGICTNKILYLDLLLRHVISAERNIRSFSNNSVVVIFFRVWVSEVVVPSDSASCFIYPGNCFDSIITVQSVRCINNRVHYDLKFVFLPVQWTLLHYHHYSHIGRFITCLLSIFCRVCV